MEINACSFERGPRGERGPGRAARARAPKAFPNSSSFGARAARPGPHSPCLDGLWGY